MSHNYAEEALRIQRLEEAMRRRAARQLATVVSNQNNPLRTNPATIQRTLIFAAQSLRHALPTSHVCRLWRESALHLGTGVWRTALTVMAPTKKAREANVVPRFLSAVGNGALELVEALIEAGAWNLLDLRDWDPVEEEAERNFQFNNRLNFLLNLARAAPAPAPVVVPTQQQNDSNDDDDNKVKFEHTGIHHALCIAAQYNQPQMAQMLIHLFIRDDEADRVKQANKYDIESAMARAASLGGGDVDDDEHQQESDGFRNRIDALRVERARHLRHSVADAANLASACGHVAALDILLDEFALLSGWDNPAFLVDDNRRQPLSSFTTSPLTLSRKLHRLHGSSATFYPIATHPLHSAVLNLQFDTVRYLVCERLQRQKERRCPDTEPLDLNESALCGPLLRCSPGIESVEPRTALVVAAATLATPRAAVHRVQAPAHVKASSDWEDKRMTEIGKLLLNAGADINAQCQASGLTVLGAVVQQGGSSRGGSFFDPVGLSGNGADPNVLMDTNPGSANSSKIPLLHLAAIMNKWSLVYFLLARTNVDAFATVPYTPVNTFGPTPTAVAAAAVAAVATTTPGQPHQAGTVTMIQDILRIACAVQNGSAARFVLRKVVSIALREICPEVADKQRDATPNENEQVAARVRHFLSGEHVYAAELGPVSLVSHFESNASMAEVHAAAQRNFALTRMQFAMAVEAQHFEFKRQREEANEQAAGTAAASAALSDVPRNKLGCVVCFEEFLARKEFGGGGNAAEGDVVVSLEEQ